MRKIITIIVVFSIITSGYAFSFAETPAGSKDFKKHFYEWTDEKGVIHITDARNKVPERYRSKAREIELESGQEAAEQQQQESRAPSQDAESDHREAAVKAEWQQRIRDWKSSLADAEKQYRELEQERNQLLRVNGSPSLAPTENKVKAEQIEQQMKQLQTEIDNAKNMIQNVIPEEARKAGVPPGWLRE